MSGARAILFHAGRARARALAQGLAFSAALAACSSNSTPSPSVPSTDATPPASPDWPAYGHDYDNSRANPEEHIITKSNVMTLEPRWLFSESAVTSTPCVLGGAAYFGDWNSVLHGVDARSGGLALANGMLFVPTLAGEARAYDITDGTLLWARAVGLSMGGGVSVSGGMVFAGHGWGWVPSGPTPGGLLAFGLP